MNVLYLGYKKVDTFVSTFWGTDQISGVFYFLYVVYTYMVDILTKYYGADIVAMMLTLVGIARLGEKKTSGFVLSIGGNMLWLVVGMYSQSAGTICANVVMIALNVRGYYQWKKTTACDESTLVCETIEAAC